MVHKGYIGPIVLTAVIIGCIFISGCLDLMNEGDQTNAFITYENTKYGVVIKYPDTWAKLENLSGDVLVTFMPDEDDVFLGVFNVSVLAGDSLDMESFKKRHIETLKNMFKDKDINISYENSTTLAGREAYTVLFTFIDSGHKFKRLEIWTLEKGTVYLLAYQADVSYYDEYIGIVEKMVDNFEIA
ncbi:unnamed protein product [marine sediment metagenome]|uniref:PsbP C-terminal domain-containing protein n=1 Tax=marine sediment metagenome TaxID=412755 RepID=X1M8H4_9ZZZZ